MKNPTEKAPKVAVKKPGRKAPEIKVVNKTGHAIPPEIQKAVDDIVADIKSGKFPKGGRICPVHGVVHPKEKPMSAAVVRRFQKMLSDIGTQKKEGFIFVCETEETPEGKLKTDGISYGNGTNRKNALQIVIDGLGLNAMEVMEVVLQK